MEPFRGLLMGMFFMAVGMELDLRTVARYPLLLPLSVIGLVCVKGGVVALVLRRLGWRQAAQAGLLMGQGGEFAFIILGYAVGALLAGITADALGIAPAVWLVAENTVGAGGVVLLRMNRRNPRQRSRSPRPSWTSASGGAMARSSSTSVPPRSLPRAT